MLQGIYCWNYLKLLVSDLLVEKVVLQLWDLTCGPLFCTTSTIWRNTWNRTSFQSLPDRFPTDAKHLKRLLPSLTQVDLSENWVIIAKCLWLIMLLPIKVAINVDHLLPHFSAKLTNPMILFCAPAPLLFVPRSRVICWEVAKGRFLALRQPAIHFWVTQH